MNLPRSESSIFVPGKNKAAIPFMRDVFTIPRNARQKPKLIGSVCQECEEYFFPKTGAKTTCDNPVCPRSTGEVFLSGKGKLLSATVTQSAGDGEHVSAVILLDEGITINSHLLGWEGYRNLLVPGSPVELVLQDLGENEWDETQVGYAFRLVTGRKKPVFTPGDGEVRSVSRADGKGKAGGAKTKKAAAQKKQVVKKKAPAQKKVAVQKKAAQKKVVVQKKAAAGKKAAAAKTAQKKKGAKAKAAARAPARKAKAPARKKTASKATRKKS